MLKCYATNPVKDPIDIVNRDARRNGTWRAQSMGGNLSIEIEEGMSENILLNTADEADRHMCLMRLGNMCGECSTRVVARRLTSCGRRAPPCLQRNMRGNWVLCPPYTAS